MEIVHVAAELAPIAKVGGLADVLFGLSRALHAQGHHIEIILPKYDCLDLSGIDELEVLEHDFSCCFQKKHYHNTLWKGKIGKIDLILIESHHPSAFFERGTIYGCDDDLDRFAYFCKASATYIQQKDSPPDIVHLHDWHTALIAPLLPGTKTIFTIHNLAYQGHSPKTLLDKIELPIASSITDDKNPEEINLLKAGIVYADAVTTVSPTYAKEILSPEGGENMQDTLHQHREKITGIINGIDYTYWNPETDTKIPFNYSATTIAIKQKNKRALQHKLSLTEADCPLVSVITRLVPQKGPSLIKHALKHTLKKGGQFILIGSTSDQDTHDEFYQLKCELATSKNVHFELLYNETLSHEVFAASDLFLVPSIFEPCGLTQMIAMRYGSVPLVRFTGGLADTVFPKVNGYGFGPPTNAAIDTALDQALKDWTEQPDTWKRLMKNGMEHNFSWNIPSKKYVALYSNLN